MTCLKPSADVENEAKKWINPVKIRKEAQPKSNRKWHQAFSQVHSIAFAFSLPRCSRIARRLRKRCRRHCWQAIVP